MAHFARGVLMTACISLICADPAEADHSATAAPNKWGAWTEIGGHAANRTPSRHGEATLWAPLFQSSVSLIFTDIRTKLYANDDQAGNFALGYRHMLNNGWNLGAWGAFDRRWSESGAPFSQFSAGFEALSPNWDLRINGYFPTDNSKWISSSATGSSDVSVELVDDSLYMITSGNTQTDITDIAFRGVDAEVGVRLPLDGLAPNQTPRAKGVPQHDVRLYLGGYYLENPLSDEMLGQRIRAEWRINDILPDWDSSRLTFEAAYRHDNIRDDDIRAGASLRIPLGGVDGRSELTAQEVRMTEGLRRDTDIATHRLVETSATPETREHVEDTATGVDLLNAIIVENEEQEQTIQSASVSLGENSLIVALGGENNHSGVELLENQTLLGGGGTIEVRGLESGTVANYTAPGERPTIYGQIVTANNSHVSGLTIQTGEGVAIVVFENQTVVIDDITSEALSNVCVGFRLNSGASWVFRSGRRASDGTSQISTAA